MSKTGSMDCPVCKVWIAECQCARYDMGDIIDGVMSEMTEEQQKEMQEECSNILPEIPF